MKPLASLFHTLPFALVLDFLEEEQSIYERNLKGFRFVQI